MRKKIVKLFLTCIISMVLIISSVLAPVIANTIQGELICTGEGHEHNNECYAINEGDKEKVLNEKVGVGDFSIKISEDIKSGLSYEAKVKLYTEDKIELDSEIREYQVIDKDGNIKKEGNTVINDYIFDNLEPGDEIVIKCIPYIDDNQKQVLASVEVISSEEGYKFDYEPSKEVLIKELDISSIVVNQEVLTKESDVFSISVNLDEGEDVDKNKTIDTFVTLGGEYSLKYILNNYNIFSFNDIEGGHIVGPVIAQNRVYKSNIFGKVNSSPAPLNVSDYSKGISSYIGRVERIDGQHVATVALNYGFEHLQNSEFVDPNFYVNYSDNNVRYINEYGNEFYKLVDGDVVYKITGNWKGSPIFQNDDFINFGEAYSKIMDESQKLLKNKYNIDITNQISSDGCLEIDAGGNYIITDATNLKKVNIKYPEGYHPISNPYPYNTVINISSNSLSKITLGGKEQNFFPNIYINGEVFSGSLKDSPETGDGQYGDSNSIVWNLPNITTYDDGNGRIVRNDESDILGHIVAPNAEFWSYEENSSGELEWVGGNNNGCAIVKSWHGGDVESHMWPYAENEIGYSVGELVLNGTKKFEGFSNDDLNNKEFKFSLEYDEDTLPEGILNQNIPQIVTSKSDGSIDFLPIKFTKAGIYNFIIKEIIPDDKGNIVYDKSEYKVIVNVSEDYNKLDVVSKVIKIKDRDGNDINSEAQVVENITFINKKEENSDFTSIDINAKKEFIGGNLSENVFQFKLELFDENQSTDGILNRESINQIVSQDNDGNIVFESIKFTKEGTYSFRIKEVLPENNDGIIYDKSEYKMDINVSESSGGLTASINKVIKVKDENGNEISSQDQVVENIIFINKKEENSDFTSIDINAKKEFTGGNLSENVFQFKLELFDENQSTDGILNSESINQIVPQDNDGNIVFESIKFTKEGTYSLRIKEVIPENNDGITYDKSEYKIDVNVSESTDGLTASINKVIKVKDENGNSVNSDITSEIVFKNTKSDEVLPAAGGDGITECILIGMVLMITSTIIFIGKSKIEVRK